MLVISLRLFSVNYTISDVGTLLTDSSQGLALNNKGQIAGTCTLENVKRLFLWDAINGLLLIDVPLESLTADISPPQYDEPYETIQKQVSISDHNFKLTDQGSIFFSLTIQHTFINKSGKAHGFAQGIPLMWNEHIGLQKIEIPLATNLSILDVNNSDTVLLGFTDNNGNHHSATYKNGLINFIDLLSYATQINDKGEILGIIKVTKDSKSVSMVTLLSNGKLTTSECTLCAKDSFNNNTDFVLFKNFDNSQFDYWMYNIKTKKSTYMGRLPTKIVNVKTNKTKEALFCKSGIQMIFTKNGKLINIKDILKLDSNIYSKWSSLVDCQDLNEKGQIVGTGVINGKKHALLLSPKR